MRPDTIHMNGVKDPADLLQFTTDIGVSPSS